MYLISELGTEGDYWDHTKQVLTREGTGEIRPLARWSWHLCGVTQNPKAHGKTVTVLIIGGLDFGPLQPKLLYQASGGILLRRQPSGLVEAMQQIYLLLIIYNELRLVPGTVDRPLLAQESGATPVLIFFTGPSCASDKADMRVGHSRRRHRGTQVTI